MTMALVSAKAYGIEVDEPVQKRFKQCLELVITGAATDVDYDFGDGVVGSLGTFWTAVGATSPGSVALAAVRDINVRAKSFQGLGGLALTHTPADLTIPAVVVLNSAAASGGNATETYVVTGLLTTDTIISCTQFVDGAGAAVGILSYGNSSGNAAANDALAVVYNADPGASAKVKVAVLRNITTVQAGTYQLSAGALTLIPNLLFLSGDAPTAFKLVLTWEYKNNEEPVEFDV